MKKPLRIYLDSADYSTLADQRRITPELERLRTKLGEWIRAGSIECWFSIAHISEMAPLDAQFTEAAVLRTELLSQLCAKRALVAPDRLLHNELSNLNSRISKTSPIYAYDGTWFPELGGIISGVSLDDVSKDFAVALNSSGGNRKARRESARKVLKGGQLKGEFLRKMAREPSQEVIDEMLAAYPMREKDARVLRRYILGTATAHEAEVAFLASLRDPSWMMQWFERHANKLSHVSEWVRGPSRKVISDLKVVAESATNYNESVAKLLSLGVETQGEGDAMRTLDATWWQAQQDKLITATARGIGKRLLGVEFDETLSASSVDAFAPGLSTAFRVMHISTWNSVGQQARNAKESDWVDALHSMYAPYVNIFRTDSYMAPIVQRVVKSHGTIVVSKLNQLEGAIETQLDAR